MVEWKNLFKFWFVLLITIGGLYVVVCLIDPNNPNLRDSVLAVAGGVFGGIAFVHYASAYPDIIPKTE
jgi:hypothetical protein